MYTVIGNKRSRTLRVLWALEEMSLPYDRQEAMPRSSEILAHNPLGKVPAMTHDGRTFTDSTAIMQYLADRHGLLTFPAGTAARARQDSWTCFALDEFDACLWTAARHGIILPEEHRVPAVKDTLRWEFARAEAHFDTLFGEGPFVMGDKFTIPDIILAHCAGWAKSAKFELSNACFIDYADRVRSRDALARAMAA